MKCKNFFSLCLFGFDLKFILLVKCESTGGPGGGYGFSLIYLQGKEISPKRQKGRI